MARLGRGNKIKGNQDSWRLSHTVRARLRRIHGAQRDIARLGSIDPAFISTVLSGARAATPEVRTAIQRYLDWMGEQLQVEAMRMEFPPQEWAGIQDSRFRIQEERAQGVPNS